MPTIKETIKNGVIYPLENRQLPEGKSVMIIIPEENPEDQPLKFKPKLSELLLLPELEEDSSIFDRNKDTGKNLNL